MNSRTRWIRTRQRRGSATVAYRKNGGGRWVAGDAKAIGPDDEVVLPFLGLGGTAVRRCAAAPSSPFSPARRSAAPAVLCRRRGAARRLLPPSTSSPNLWVMGKVGSKRSEGSRSGRCWWREEEQRRKRSSTTTTSSSSKGGRIDLSFSMFHRRAIIKALTPFWPFEGTKLNKFSNLIRKRIKRMR